MSWLSRRTFLIGAIGAGAIAAVPATSGGLSGFLRRTLANHFGPDILKVDGIDDFVAEYAAQTGTGSLVRRIGSKVYFAFRGDAIHKIGAVTELEKTFLQTVLVRSNIIAVYQGEMEALEFTSVDPWEPSCGLYISALADPTV